MIPVKSVNPKAQRKAFAREINPKYFLHPHDQNKEPPRAISVQRIPGPIEVQVNGHSWQLTQEEALELRKQIGIVLNANVSGVLSQIKCLCARKFDVSLEAINSQLKNNQVIRARWSFMWLAKHAGFSHNQIAEACGERNHSGITHAMNTFEIRLEMDASLRTALRFLVQIAKRENGIIFTFTDKMQAILGKP